MIIDTITEEQYLRGDYLDPGEAPYFTTVTRRKKIGTGFLNLFKREIDAEIFILTQDHVIITRFDGVPNYCIKRIPYSSIDQVKLMKNTKLHIILLKLDNFIITLGEDASWVFEEIQKRRGDQNE